MQRQFLPTLVWPLLASMDVGRQVSILREEWEALPLVVSTNKMAPVADSPIDGTMMVHIEWGAHEE